MSTPFHNLPATGTGCPFRSTCVSVLPLTITPLLLGGLLLGLPLERHAIG